LEDKIKVTIDYLKKKKVDYADIRLQKKLAESIKVKNKNVESISRNEDQGFGIRVINSGSWGFASSSVTTEAEMKRVANKAIQIAKASAITKKENVVLAEQESFVDKYQSFYQLDPFTVPLDRKIELLLNSTQILSKSKKIKVAEGYMGFYKTDKVFASTEGAYITQAILESGAGIFATAVDDGEVQRRSYPGSHTGDFATRGYEFIQEMRFLENAERTREEAIQLLSADPCPDTTTTLIITGPQIALQIHESCGHPTELDRVLGTEISLAGGSFLTLDKLSKLRYGSDKVSITADATVPGGLGTFGYDDEGVKAQRSFLVKDGLFVGYLTSRETAPVLKQKSNGTMRADGWNRIPLIRMTNINLEPGEWELKNGKVGKVYKNPVYTGITPEFWNSCDAVCNRKHWRVWGVPNCGKGEPMQIMHVAHGASPTRFRNIKVGVSK